MDTSLISSSITRNHEVLSPKVAVSNHLISDHFLIVATMVIGQSARRVPRTIPTSNLRVVSVINFSKDVAVELAHIDVIKEAACTDSVCESYYTAVRRALDKHGLVYVRTFKQPCREKMARWIIPDTMAAHRLRRANEMRWRCSGLEVHRKIFQEHRDDIYTNSHISAKCAY